MFFETPGVSTNFFNKTEGFGLSFPSPPLFLHNSLLRGCVQQTDGPSSVGGVRPNFYSYVANNPVSFTDPFGLRIHIKLTEGAPQYDMAKTCRGKQCGSCYKTAPSGATACKKTGCCYGFNYDMAVTIGQQFTVSKEDANGANGLMSLESPGLTLQQHEDLHMGDLRQGFADDAINAAIKTDGFKRMPACRAARLTRGK